MSQSTPTLVTLASEFSSLHRSFPEQGGHITMGELQSISTRLHYLKKTAAALIDTVEQIRLRAVHVSPVEEKKI